MPPKAAKAVEKTVAKDEAQVVYVNFKLTAPAPPPVVPPPASTTASAAAIPTASAAATTGTATAAATASAPAAALAESPSKDKLKAAKGAKAPEPAAAAPAPAAPAVEETQEVSFEIIPNLICRTDIFIDYVRRQAIKLIQEKLAAEDPEKKIGDPMRTKLKDLQTDLTGKMSADLVLRDNTGADIVFREVRSSALSACLLSLIIWCMCVLHPCL
jgi:hypothetical protein